MRQTELTPLRRLLVVLAPGEEIVASLTTLALTEGIRSAAFTGIGVVSDARIGYLNPRRNDYDVMDVDDPAEVIALSGSIVSLHGEPSVHAHIAVSLADSSARGGHLLAAHVHPTVELFVDEFDTAVTRAFDETTGQELIAL